VVQPILISFPNIVRIVLLNVMASGIRYEKINLRICESVIVKCRLRSEFRGGLG
jgi:hypothetical protein